MHIDRAMKNLLKSLGISEEDSDEILDAHKREVRHAMLSRKEQDAKAHMQDTCDRFSDDPTGQDGEDEIEQAAHDYVEAGRERYESRFSEEQLQEMRMGA
tara:strand:- start:495 stop:794 length:300 start_codon:yes stop_codon:yes gene_type:complete